MSPDPSWGLTGVWGEGLLITASTVTSLPSSQGEAPGLQTSAGIRGSQKPTLPFTGASHFLGILCRMGEVPLPRALEMSHEKMSHENRAYGLTGIISHFFPLRLLARTHGLCPLALGLPFST